MEIPERIVPIPEAIPPHALPRPERPTVPEGPRFRMDGTGALITWVEQDGPAQIAGLQVGDIITAVAKQQVDEQNPLDRVLRNHKPGDEVQVSLMRGAEEKTITLRLGRHPDDPSRPYLGIGFSMITLPFRR